MHNDSMSFSEENMFHGFKKGTISTSNLEKNEDPFEVQLRDNIIKEKEFRYVGAFDEEGRAIAVGGSNFEKKYLIDKTGEIVAGPLQHIQPFSDGLARIKKDDGYYFIDRQGKEVLGPIEKSVTIDDFKNGVAVISDSRLPEFQYCIDKQGQRIPKEESNEIVRRLSEEKMAKSIESQTDKGKRYKKDTKGFYFLDSEGKETGGPFNFDMVRGFSEGLYLVNIAKEGETYGECYFVDPKGQKMLGPFHGRTNSYFKEGVSMVLDPNDRDKSYYIDHNGKEVFSK
ncbi:MAG: hypothetical protein QG583_661 [Patescibacteria group bacterium]|jgi:hypothetical protein|nr:hypothetical protein [Patescibacteria group bacterium]